jgi:valyl-tRNA synthetase
MKGYRTLWLPGTDHAGIATQYVVEKELKKEGKNRWDLGREKFIEKVWQWKNKYGGLILGQLKKIGVSADWSRTRFTMDPVYSRDVLKAFIHYYQKRWIYRGLRTINWCPRCATSLSELELQYSDEKTELYYIKYGPFTLATVRPETKFGDTALAVNPKDNRYKKYIGKILEVESLDTGGDLNRPAKIKIKLKIVADNAVDPKFGTGVVKVTPAHDITDFEIAERHQLPLVQIINEQGRLNERVGKYAGMKTAEARKKIIEDLKAVGLMEKTESYEHRVAKCYRCNSTIEPLPSKQWFLKMKDLANKALKAVHSGKVKIYPKNFEKPYFSWLNPPTGGIRDWAISRQIWWGHRLPIFFCKRKSEETPNFKSQIPNNKEQFVVSLEKPRTCPFCKNCGMEQSADVLDTWFSSALWPFAGLSKKDLKNYYPGNTLITARDIINLWVARMIFSGLEFMGKVPFTQVFINGTILTKEGKRMSKSKGTGVDPLDYIERYGADAARFAVIWQATGQDIHWDEAAVIAGRKFTNKIWNASRFVLTQLTTNNLKLTTNNFQQIKLQTAADKKILKELSITKKKVKKYLENFEFSKALREIYGFFWRKYCDIYLEKSKKQLITYNLQLTTQRILLYVLFESLKILHPFLPFITEEIYQKLPLKDKKLLIITPWT